MASTSTWTPPPGRHQVNVGPSLVRSIKSRKRKGSPGAASSSGPTKRSNIPEREFYAFRYNFKPNYMDFSKPASMEIKKSAEVTQLWAEFPSKESNEVATYNGSEVPAKEVDCILIYDEETGQYTLEKLDSYVSLLFEGKKAVIPSIPSSAPSTSSTPSVHVAPPASSLPSNNKGKKKQEDGDGLERPLLGGDTITATKRAAPASSTLNGKSKVQNIPAINIRKEEEEEEGEEVEIPLSVQLSARRLPPTQRPSASTTPNTRPTKPLPKTTPTSRRPTPPLAPLSQSQTSGSSKVTSSVATPSGAQTSKPAPRPTKNKTIPTTADGATLQPPAKKARVATTAATTSSATTTTNTPMSRQPKIPTQTQTTPVNPPIPKPPTELSLPSKQSTFSLPPAPASLPKKPTTAPIPAAPPPVPIPMTVPPGVSATITMEEVLGDEDDEEEDWEQVPTPGAMPLPATAVSSSSSSSSQPPEVDYDVQLENEIFGALAAEEEGEEIDVNAFEAELNAEMGFEMDDGDGDGDEDDDMEDAMMEPVPTSDRQPISLNRLASGMDPMAMDADSDDDFSSSDSDSD